MKYTRLGVTALDDYWLGIALKEFCGYGTSVIGCDAEVGVESFFTESNSPDGRKGANVMLFGFSTDILEKAVVNRVGQCLMTCPTTAVFNAMPLTENSIAVGKSLRFFGDGFQKSKLLGDQRFWRIPVMDGEFIVEEKAGIAKGVAGGNFLIQAVDQKTGLDAARRSVEAIDKVANVITPFPGGVVRSGSKVGSKYKMLRASTSDSYCPSLRGQVATKLHAEANCVYEIVIDGADRGSVAKAMVNGITAAVGEDQAGVVSIGAGNYGGKLGQHHFHLHELFRNQPHD